jgi:phage/plasmid-associated DNA primase
LKTQQRVTPNPDDFINFTCGYEYDFAYDTSKNTTELQKIIDMILPDKEVQNYDLEILASGMCGIQVQKVFMNNGKGGNGKSLLNGLAMKTMGHYSYDMPSSLLSEKIKLGANPEAAKLDRKRLVFGCEPDANSPLCCAVLKPLTGEPTLGVRECFSNKVGISLNLTLIIACNDKPQLDEVNDAVTRRMKGAVVPFSSKFVSQSTIDELTIENEGVKPANLFLANEFYVGDEFKIIYKQALFHILLARFPDYLKNQLNVVPDIVLRLSRDYMACSDNIYDWFLETYEKDPNEMVFVDDVFSQFSFSQKFLQMTKMEKRKYASVGKFKDKLESNLFIARYYRPKDKYWKQEQIKKPFIEGWKLIPEVTHQQIGQTTTQ